MSYKNSEGYSDPTAGVAMGSAKKQEQEIDKLNHKVMQSFRLLLDLAGFEIVGRVTLRHKKSGRIPWSGKHYSERLWKNSKTLTKAIKEELLIDLITGRPENEAVKIIANKFDQGIFEARRLVRTEAAFVSGELNAEAYEECDLQKYQFLATLDLRTSEICRSLDGKRFFLKDRQVGKNYPPMHPWCRSTTIAVISEGDIKKLKRRALNPETGRTELVPASMTYAEWYKKYVKDNPKAKGQEKAIQNKASDQAQYQKYKKSGIDGVPASFTGFQKLKYQEPEKWELLKKDYRERKKQ